MYMGMCVGMCLLNPNLDLNRPLEPIDHYRVQSLCGLSTLLWTCVCTCYKKKCRDWCTENSCSYTTENSTEWNRHVFRHAFRDVSATCTSLLNPSMTPELMSNTGCLPSCMRFTFSFLSLKQHQALTFESSTHVQNQYPVKSSHDAGKRVQAPHMHTRDYERHMAPLCIFRLECKCGQEGRHSQRVVRL